MTFQRRRQITEVPAPAETSPASLPCSDSGRSGTLPRSRPGLPWRMRWQRLRAKQTYRGYILWCELRSLIHRIGNPRSKTELTLPCQCLGKGLGRDHPLRNSAIVASIRYIKSVEVEMPWASLFGLSLALEGWAAGAEWGVHTSGLRIDTDNVQP